MSTHGTAREIADGLMDVLFTHVRWRMSDGLNKHRDAIEAAIAAAERRGIERAAEKLGHDIASREGTIAELKDADVKRTLGASVIVLDAARSRILALLPEGDGWLPIESAPKDGTHFLAFQRGGNPDHYECWWHEDWPRSSYWTDVADSEPEPTHWRPLPNPPTAKE